MKSPSSITPRPLIFLLVAFLFSTGLVPLTAQWNQELIPLDDPVYELTEILYTESGMVLPSQARPWSRSELTYMMDKLDPFALSSRGRQTLTQLREENTPESLSESEDIAFRLSPVLSFEYFSHLITLSLGRVPEAYPAEYTAQDRKAFLEIPFQISCFDTLYMESNLDFRETPRVDLLKDDTNRTNLPAEIYDLDYMFPHRAYINTGGEGWDISLGRFAEEWGNGRTGNMYLSANSDYIDQLRGKGYWDRFVFTYIFASLDARVDSDGDYSRNYEANKSMTGHRFEFTPLPWLHLSFVEGLIMGGEDFNLTITHLNPMMLYHNWFTGIYGNSYHSLEADIAIPGFRFYTQLGLDQFQSSSEASEYPEAANEPSAYGIMAGYESTHPLEKGYLRTGFEFAYTMPYLYTYSDYYTRPTNGQFYSSDESFILETPLGYHEGPDSIVFSLYGEYRKPLDWFVSLEAAYTINGANTIKTLYPFWDEATDDLDYVTPTGITETEWKFALDGEKHFNEHISAGAGLTLLLRDNPEPLLVDEPLRYTGTLNSLEWNIYVTLNI